MGKEWLIFGVDPIVDVYIGSVFHFPFYIQYIIIH